MLFFLDTISQIYSLLLSIFGRTVVLMCLFYKRDLLTFIFCPVPSPVSFSPTSDFPSVGSGSSRLSNAWLSRPVRDWDVQQVISATRPLNTQRCCVLDCFQIEVLKIPHFFIKLFWSDRASNNQYSFLWNNRQTTVLIWHHSGIG